jgi:hypothetical protein
MEVSKQDPRYIAVASCSDGSWHVVNVHHDSIEVLSEVTKWLIYSSMVKRCLNRSDQHVDSRNLKLLRRQIRSKDWLRRWWFCARGVC